ncbi:MAG: hypothetical protein ACRCXC_05485 [Legionella sp.]
MYQKSEQLSSAPTAKPTNLHCKPIEDSELVKNIRQLTGVPAATHAKVSRSDLKIDHTHWIHLDIGGEGLNEHMGYISGFETSINLNATTEQSNQYGIPIPNLVQIQSWFTNQSYPFKDGFADYITMQNAPLTSKNIEEISRCLRPGGIVELWIDEQFEEKITLLATRLNSKPEYDTEDPFHGSTGSKKVRICSGIHHEVQREKTLTLLKTAQINALNPSSFFNTNSNKRLRILPPTSFSSDDFMTIQRHADLLKY